MVYGARLRPLSLRGRGFESRLSQSEYYTFVNGGLAQSEECVVRNDEAPGSKPGTSKAIILSFKIIALYCTVHTWGQPGVEPGTSRTLNENHAARPLAPKRITYIA